MGWRKPLNKTKQGGSLDTFQMQVGSGATAVKMLPGIAVMRDGNDYSVKEWASGGQMIGYLSYENSADKPEDMDTPYAVGDFVGVDVGPGRRQFARLAASQTIVYGQPLSLDTDGYLKAATVNGAVTVDESGTATVQTGNTDIVADAAESVTTTASTGKIWIVTRK